MSGCQSWYKYYYYLNCFRSLIRCGRKVPVLAQPTPSAPHLNGIGISYCIPRSGAPIGSSTSPSTASPIIQSTVSINLRQKMSSPSSCFNIPTSLTAYICCNCHTYSPQRHSQSEAVRSCSTCNHNLNRCYDKCYAFYYTVRIQCWCCEKRFYTIIDHRGDNIQRCGNCRYPLADGSAVVWYTGGLGGDRWEEREPWWVAKEEMDVEERERKKEARDMRRVMMSAKNEGGN